MTGFRSKKDGSHYPIHGGKQSYPQNIQKIKEPEKIHRRYPGSQWDYKAISCIILSQNNKKTNVVYYMLKNKGKNSEGVEVFSGKNYIVGSSDPSHSRKYDMDKIPENIKSVVHELKSIHKRTTWSTKKYVNEN